MYAGIDAGSNTIRLALASVDRGTLRQVHSRRETTRLAAGLTRSGHLDSAALRKSRDVFRSFADDILRHKAVWTVAVGTGAFRDAPEGADLAGIVRKETGIVLNIIDQETEALLTLMGAGAALGVRGDLEVVDIGGRSTEVIRRGADGRTGFHGLALGVVCLAEDYLEGDPPPAGNLGRLRLHIEQTLAASSLPPAPVAGSVLAGTGGTFTCLAALDQGLAAYDRDRINGYSLGRQRLEELANILCALPEKRRQTLRGMDAGRADIIIPGAILAAALVRRLGRREIIASDSDILEGCILAGLGGRPPLHKSIAAGVRRETA